MTMSLPVLFILLFLDLLLPTPAAAAVPYVRPPPSKRCMNSSFIDALIDRMQMTMRDPDLATLFANCFPNTLDQTVHAGWSGEDAFVITGDIPALWLRDSMNQVMPYMPFVSEAPELRALVRGLVLRHLRSVALDPYANAFNYDDSGAGHQTDLRDPPMSAGLFEGKYELDSLAAVLKLLTSYVNSSGDVSVVVNANGRVTPLFDSAISTVLETIENATLSTDEAFAKNANLPFYRFMRDNPWEYDVYPRPNATPSTGMARSAFRPSDDMTKYDFLVPSNIMAAVELQHLADMCERFPADPTLHAMANKARQYSDKMVLGLRKYAVVHAGGATILAYEVDGTGQVNLMDDPNVPSLLSAPLLGMSFAKEAPGTRQWLLSEHNPYYYCGTLGCGLGSPHTPRGWIWPMALMVRALTSSDEDEIKTQLSMLKAAAAATGWMHESFSPDDPSKYTRPWFAWANTLFGETVLTIGRRFPHLIYKNETY